RTAPATSIAESLSAEFRAALQLRKRSRQSERSATSQGSGVPRPLPELDCVPSPRPSLAAVYVASRPPRRNIGIQARKVANRRHCSREGEKTSVTPLSAKRGA